jgi:hypothetical protein
MTHQDEKKSSNKNGSNVALIVVIVLLIVLILAIIAGCGCYYAYNKVKDGITTEIQTQEFKQPYQEDITIKNQDRQQPTTTVESPRQVVNNYLLSTLGSIPGAYVDYEYAKTYTSYEIAQKLNDSSFVPRSYCIQDAPEDVVITSEYIDGMEAYVIVDANYGGDSTPMWEFILVSGEEGWKIWSIECLMTGQITR